MIRYAAAVAVTLFLMSPSWLCAQSTELAVNTTSANVHKSPSTGSPVIGAARRGTRLEVTRELGSWVKVSWPEAQDGVGYVHLSVGSITRSSTPAPNPAAGLQAARPAPESVSPTTTSVSTSVTAEHIGAGVQPTSVRTRTAYIPLPTHIVGLGGRVGGSTRSFGATTRAWTRNGLGIQLEVSRSALTSAVAPGRVTSIQYAPSVLYSLPDRLAGYAWVRPYLGGGADLYRLTVSDGTPGVGDSVSDNRLGLQAFGGSEVTFAGAPRFALSADLGYHWSRTPFAGFEVGGLGFSLSGHWYVR